MVYLQRTVKTRFGGKMENESEGTERVMLKAGGEVVVVKAVAVAVAMKAYRQLDVVLVVVRAREAGK